MIAARHAGTLLSALLVWLDARASGTYSSHVIESAQRIIDSQAAGLHDPD